MQKTSFSDAQDVNTSTSKAHVPAHNLITIPPSWPFTKWMEYKPIIKISADRAVDFICDILYRFDFSHTIITDLGSNFTSQSFWEFCENACIDVKYVSPPRASWHVPAHPPRVTVHPPRPQQAPVHLPRALPLAPPRVTVHPHHGPK